MDRTSDRVRPFDPFQTLEHRYHHALERACQAAAGDAILLLSGEPGTGKKTLARALHDRSSRSGGPFVVVKCFGASPSFLAQQLFGAVVRLRDEAACFSGQAVAAAAGGTLYLDGVDALFPRYWSRAWQLARAVPRDVRLMASREATGTANAQQEAWWREVTQERNVVETSVPPLSARPRDILPLAYDLLNRLAAEARKELTAFTPRALAALTFYSWPGNLSELNAVMQHAVSVAGGPTLGLSDLPSYLVAACFPHVEVGAQVTVKELVAEHIRAVVQNTNSLTEAAEILGVAPSTLYRKRKRKSAE